MAPASVLPPWLWPRSAYLHVPFCAHRCSYCDFAIAVGKDELTDRYVEALIAELTILETPQEVDTLFLGGGTPSQLTASQLERLLAKIRHWLPVQTGHEFTVEANPDSLSADKIAVLADHGVTRISLGAQSFHPQLLRQLGRSHTSEEVPFAVERIRARMDQVSLDLIFGAPGQTAAEWREDLNRSLTLKPDHIATYGLTYEKGTPLWKQRRAGLVQSLSEDAELELYMMAHDVLSAAGYEHYEISNFALPGHRCRHNGVYWANWAYFGFGMGAARYVHGRRQLNTRNLLDYMRRTLEGQSATFQSEELLPEDRARETVALGMRRVEGVARETIRLQTGFDVDALCGAAIRQCADLGLIADDGATVRLTRRGTQVADAVIERLL